jgi:hypothetical protein
LCLRGNSNGAVCLPKTGQTTSYYPGDDGDLQKGVSCPVQRFTDNGDGTITDNLTGLMWEKASSTTVYNWNDAFTRITSLNLSKLAGHIDWRLPNRKEIISLINFECLDPLLQGFTGISEGYWTSNSYAENSYYAWWGSIKWISVDSVITNGKNNVFYVIGVRGG